MQTLLALTHLPEVYAADDLPPYPSDISVPPLTNGNTALVLDLLKSTPAVFTFIVAMATADLGQTTSKQGFERLSLKGT